MNGLGIVFIMLIIFLIDWASYPDKRPKIKKRKKTWHIDLTWPF